MKIVTGKVRLSYPNLFEAFAWGDEKPKYSLMILVSKDDQTTVNLLRKAEKDAAEQAVTTKWGGKKPHKLESVIMDGDLADTEKYPERKNHYYLTARSTTKPSVVDQNIQPILDPTEVYAGCYVRVSLTSFAYVYAGKHGVSFALNNLQKMGEGEPFGATSRPEDDFQPLNDHQKTDLI